MKDVLKLEFLLPANCKQVCLTARPKCLWGTQVSLSSAQNKYLASKVNLIEAQPVQQNTPQAQRKDSLAINKYCVPVVQLQNATLNHHSDFMALVETLPTLLFFYELPTGSRSTLGMSDTGTPAASMLWLKLTGSPLHAILYKNPTQTHLTARLLFRYITFASHLLPEQQQF